MGKGAGKGALGLRKKPALMLVCLLFGLWLVFGGSREPDHAELVAAVERGGGVHSGGQLTSLQAENQRLREQMSQQGAAPASAALGGDMLHLGNEVKELRQKLGAAEARIERDATQLGVQKSAPAGQPAAPVTAPLPSADLQARIEAAAKVTPPPGASALPAPAIQQQPQTPPPPMPVVATPVATPPPPPPPPPPAPSTLPPPPSQLVEEIFSYAGGAPPVEHRDAAYREQLATYTDGTAPPPPTPPYAPPTAEVLKQRQDAIRGAIKHTWDNYHAHAWGQDNLNPVSGRGSSGGFGHAVTMVDSLDTLWIAVRPLLHTHPSPSKGVASHAKGFEFESESGVCGVAGDEAGVQGGGGLVRAEPARAVRVAGRWALGLRDDHPIPRR